jgi:asparagine synthase (glutamine-hydrolysing)
MCGIAGYISLDNTITTSQLKEATALIQHRGPDANGFYFSADNKIGLAHRRLSILDLSTSANQPLFSVDGRYCIVYNGEVYNFKELQSELVDKGASLKTTSDTEVILQLFIEQGAACFAKLNGMFALAIYDTIQNKLTLARDQIGIKPLFYYYTEKELVFGSELKVIKEIKKKSLSINKNSIPYFLHLGYIPEPLTIYNDVCKFPAGAYWEIDLQQMSSIQQNIVKYWQLENKIAANPLTNEVTAKKELKDLLINSVEKQLISDVPVGTFLSGGIDSSLVTAIASDLTSHKIKTFNIAIDTGKYNESAYARAVAKKLGTEHFEFDVKEKEVLELVDSLLSTYDEPFGDPSAFPTMIVSELAKKYVTVTLSGDGGDELFMGYGSYQWAKRLNNPLMPLVRWQLYSISTLLNERLQRAGQMFAYPNKHDLITHIFSTEQYYFSQQELDKLITTIPFDFYQLNEIPATARNLSSVEKQSFWDLSSYLKDDLLVKVDRASMRSSLETRVPLLDYRIVEFSFNLQQNLKISSNGSMKYLLKEVLYDYLPEELFSRPKSGFGIPLEKWMRTDLKYLVDKYTSKAIIEKHDYVRYKVVDDIKKQYYAGKNYLYNRLWLLMILHWWLESNEL